MIDAELDSLIKRSKNYLDSISGETDPQLITLIHRYLCVLFSANIDKAIQLIFTEYARRRGTDELRRFVARTFARSTNYQTERVTQTLNAFSTDWGKAFGEEVAATDLKERLDSLYGLRNSISHGEQITVSRPSLDGYFEAHVRVIKLLKTIVLK